MYISTVSSQGQTTIPSRVRKLLNLEPGKSIVWEEALDTAGVKHIKVYPSGFDYLLSLKGIAKDFAQKHGSNIDSLKMDREEWDRHYQKKGLI